MEDDTITHATCSLTLLNYFFDTGMRLISRLNNIVDQCNPVHCCLSIIEKSHVLCYSLNTMKFVSHCSKELLKFLEGLFIY